MYVDVAVGVGVDVDVDVDVDVSTCTVLVEGSNSTGAYISHARVQGQVAMGSGLRQKYPLPLRVPPKP